MKKTESLFISISALVILGALGVMFAVAPVPPDYYDDAEYIRETKYGAFLAAQHAVYVNDFDRAARFTETIPEADVASIATVTNARLLAQFLSGRMPDTAKLLGDEKGAPSRLIYDAYLINQGDWKSVYDRHKKDESPLSAPLRIWSTVAVGKRKEALAFIKSLNTNESWQSFVRGQIYAATGDATAAAAEFAKVRTDFLNINDYQYLMAFYTRFDMPDAARALRDDFTRRPGSMFMLSYPDAPDWETFDGMNNSLAFGLIQNVSHTQIMMYSDLSLLLLRFAQIVHNGAGNNADTINYYVGQYFYNNGGDDDRFFQAISPASPFAPFAAMRMADSTRDMAALRRVVDAHPLFVPAINKLVAAQVRDGDRRGAMATLTRALGNKNLNDIGRAYFLKSRAGVNLVFGDLDAAQHDIHDAADILPVDAEILGLQAKIWAAQNRELDNAYDYAMALVRKSPADVAAWDVLGAVVAAREGVDAALELLARVGEVAATCSSLFERLGDLYAASGDMRLARDAYMRAIDLADDGLTSRPAVEKKLRKLK